MFEQIIQMSPMLILAGLMAGWVAQTFSRADRYGFIHDMVFGLIGSVIGGAAIWVVVSSNAGMLAMLLIGCGGAAIAIVAQRIFWRSSWLGTRESAWNPEMTLPSSKPTSLH
jgi:uncharacterized membrane protein YeaQ/YmgE (transglycosylase-associated protein family)